MLTGQAIVSQPLVTGGNVEGITVHHQETVEVIDNQGVDSQATTEVVSSNEIGDQDVVSSDQDMMSGDQDVTETVDQKSAEPVSDQEIIDSITSQNVKVIADQPATTLISIANQVVNEVVSSQNGNVVVDQQATDQDTNKVVDDQEDVNEAVDQEVIVSQGVVEPVTNQVKEVISDQEVTELVNNQENIDNQDLVNTDQSSVTSQSVMVGSSQISQPPSLPMNIPQDPASHDVVDTPHHSKSILEQDDIWQSSFIITQPSCINCPSELRSLWREPMVENKVSTQPLQHYTLSLNSDQVICCDVILHHQHNCNVYTYVGIKQRCGCFYGYCWLQGITRESNLFYYKN